MKKFIFHLLTLVAFVGCMPDKSNLRISMPKKGASVSSSVSTASVSSVQIINNQLVINGNGFVDVANVKVSGQSFNEVFSIESKSATKIIANSIKAFSFDISKVFSLILSDANASATFAIDFSLCNATLNGKGFNCATSVADKDVLSYDAVSGTWKPRAVSGLNYLGAFNASANPAVGPATQPAGAYYIISASGSIAGIPFTTGDWLVSNGSSWQKIDNSTAVLSVFGRSGSVAAQSGDYNLDMLGDISFPTAPVAGKVLKFDGTNWVAGDDISGGGAGSVTTTEILDGAVTDAKITTLSTSKLTGTISSAQITDGTIVNADINAAAAIDYSKLNVPDGAIPAVKISGLPVLSTILAASITDGDTTHAPTGEAVYEALLTKIGTGGGTLSVGTISGIPTPVNPTDVSNKAYVNSEDALRLLKAGDTMSGVLTLDNNLRVKGGANYVTIKGSAASTAYDLTLPTTKGTNGFVLATDGNGVTSWVDVNSAIASLDTDDVTEGTKLYFTEPRVLGTDLAGLNTGVDGPITAVDTVLGAFGKMQYQVTDLKNKGQWEKNGSDVYFLNNVGIGTSIPLSNLHVADASTFPSIQYGAWSFLGTGQSNYPYYGFASKFNKTTLQWDSTHPTIAGMMFRYMATGFLFDTLPVNTTNATPVTRMFISNSTGNVGIGTTTPQSKLDVSGSVRIGADATGCTVAIAGAMRFNTPNVEFCNGSAWAPFGVSNAAVSSSEITNGTIVDADVNAAANITATKLGTGAVDNTEFNYLNGVTSSIQTQLDSKEASLPTGGTAAQYFAGNKTLQTLNTLAVPELTNLYFTQARVIASPLTGVTSTAGAITASDTIVGAFGKLLNTQNDYVSKTGNSTITGTMTINTIVGALKVPSPMNVDDAVPKSYVDGFGQWTKTGSDIYRAGGSVGIGTDTPAYPLDVAGDIRSTTNLRVGTGSAGISTAGNDIVLKDANNNTSFRGTRSTTAWSDAVNTQWFQIGNASDNVSFSSSGGLAAARMKFQTTSLQVSTGAGSNVPTGVFEVSNNTTGLFNVLSTGYVGIGTTAPTTKLVVVQPTGGATPPAIQVRGSTNGMVSFVADTDNINGGMLEFAAGATEAAQPARGFIIKNMTNGTSDFFINPSGNVGIGTTTPDDRLVVYNGTTTGRYTTGGWTHSSDARLKHDISPIEDSLNKILKIKGVEYKFNNDPENKNQLGFIAQQVEPIFPEVVVTDKKGFKSMVYSNLIAPLVEAVKSLYGRIVSVEKHNVSQDRQIAALKAENAQLKSYLCSKDPKAVICH